NLLMGAFLPRSWRKRHAALEHVYGLIPGLRERAGQRARTLSGGERRLVGLGRGLMREASILLIDEPSLGLAPVAIERVYAAIRDIHAQGTTILLVEENFTHIGDVADIVHVVEMGSIVRTGPLEELSRDQTVVQTYLGSIYGLVAIGMTLIYGTLRILDMSQGSMVMVGSFVGWGVLVVAGWSPALAILFAFAITFALGTFTELISVQPLMGRRGFDFEMVTFITTFAVAIVFANVALQVFGPFQKNVSPVVSGGIDIYRGVDLSYQNLTMALVSIGLMAALGLFLARTRWGLAIRAVAQDLD